MKLFSSAVLVAAVAGRGPDPEPREPLTCADANIKDRRPNGIFDRYGRGFESTKTCKFSQLLEQLGKDQMRRAIWHVGKDNEYEDLVEVNFSRIITEWKVLSGESDDKLDCSFDDEIEQPTKRLSVKRLKYARDPISCRTPEEPSQCLHGSGFIDKCYWWCPFSRPIESFGKGEMEENAKLVIRETLDTILLLVNEYFARYHAYKSGNDPDDKWRLEWCARVPHWPNTPYSGRRLNRHNEECEVTDKCGQAVRFIYREAKKFQPIIGEIEKLSGYQRSWEEDRDH